MKRIKTVLVCLLATFLIGCDLDDDNTNFFYELVSIESVSVPDSFTRGETYTIDVNYFRPSSCHGFAGFDYNRFANERTVSVVNLVVNPDNCEDLGTTELIEQSFDFVVGIENSYVFRFWQGRDDDGNNQFLTIEVPVEN
ncbi:hypothetical protein M0D21_16640 [Aquimarina sp. D1M17]|uniref:hypothetical protein n=1 Tax=Aquimarina acroporae TaxID=2937283 RepID=UPI0020BE09B1|nr:hypothetical protein [Aquimarina acroporae]MCK8523209.1 hypothetical protein [Aquimarina acroporae]